MKIDVYFILIALDSTVIWAWQERVHIPSPKVNYIMVKGGRLKESVVFRKYGVLTRTVMFFFNYLFIHFRDACYNYYLLQALNLSYIFIWLHQY